MIDVHNIKLTPKQSLFVNSKSRYIALAGGIASGKTVVGSLKGIDLCLRNPGIMGAVIRNTNPELESSTKKIFMEILYQIDKNGLNGQRVILAENNQKNWVKLVNGSMVFFFHTDDIGLYKGPEFGWFLIDQAEEVDEDIVKRITERLRQKGYPQVGMFLANTDRGHNWIYHWFKKKEKPFSELIEITILDNAENLSKEYLLDQFSRPEDEKAIWLYGSWDNPHGLILRLNENHFIRPFKPPEGWFHYIAVDPAGSTGTTGGLHYIIDYDGNFYFTDEYYQSNKLIKEHASGIIKLGGHKMRLAYFDPSAWRKQEIDKDGAPQFITLADRYREYGIYPVPAENSIAIGIDVLRDLAVVDPNRKHPFTGELGSPRIFFVTEKLPNLMEEIASWMVDAPSREPIHLCDALRYAVASRPAKPMLYKKYEANEDRLAFMGM